MKKMIVVVFLALIPFSSALSSGKTFDDLMDSPALSRLQKLEIALSRAEEVASTGDAQAIEDVEIFKAEIKRLREIRGDVVAKPIKNPSPEIQWWHCFSYGDTRRSSVLIKAGVLNDNDNEGIIDAAGIKYAARYHPEGIDRRWNFGSENSHGGANYSLVVRPDGKSSYYDFSGIKSKDERVYPNQSFQCHKQ